MSWSIALLENTVEVSAKIAEELVKAQSYKGEFWSNGFEVTYKGKLYFNPDHSEHMDFLTDEKLLEVLTKNKVEGRICFASLEGDNRGEFWGYEFDGKGAVHALVGSLVFQRKIVEPEIQFPKEYVLVKTSRVYYGGPVREPHLPVTSLDVAIALARGSVNPVGYDVYELVPRGTEALHPVWRYADRASYKQAVDQIDPLHDGVE